jgi:uncharacterized protein (TIGR03083 family)
MNDDELWAAIDAQRARTVRLLQDLKPADWELASLCDGWRVRDVAAHLTMQQMTLGDALKALLRHPGGMNHVNHANAVSAANRPTEELIAEIGGMIGSRRHNVGVTPRDTLIDIIVHGQDIAIPLRRRLDVPTEAAAIAATQVWSSQDSRKGRLLSRVFRPVPYRSYRLMPPTRSGRLGTAWRSTDRSWPSCSFSLGARPATPSSPGPAPRRSRPRSA